MLQVSEVAKLIREAIKAPYHPSWVNHWLDDHEYQTTVIKDDCYYRYATEKTKAQNLGYVHLDMNTQRILKWSSRIVDLILNTL